MAQPLRAGDMDKAGKILRPSKAAADGGRERHPDTVVPQWFFKLDSSSGREAEVARQMVPLATHILRGWNPGVEVSHQDYIEWEGRRLNIEHADPNQERGRVLMLVCVEQAQ